MFCIFSHDNATEPVLFTNIVLLVSRPPAQELISSLSNVNFYDL